jgi:hypothetical protein
MPLAALVVAGCGLLIFTVLVLDFTGVLHRGTGFRWQAIGLLSINGAVDALGFAHLRGWTDSRIVALESVTIPVMLSGCALLIVGVILQSRERRKARRAGPGDGSLEKTS